MVFLPNGSHWQVYPLNSSGWLVSPSKGSYQVAFQMRSVHLLLIQLLYCSASLTDCLGGCCEGGCHLQILEHIPISCGPSSIVATWPQIKMPYRGSDN